jgi:hypothetical protein
MRAAGFVSETVCVLWYAACPDGRGGGDRRVLRMFVINGVLSMSETAVVEKPAEGSADNHHGHVH